MKKLFSISLLALLLSGFSFAQQEISPDRFEGDVAKPAKVKHEAKPANARLTQAKHHASKPANKPVLAARVVTGN